MLKFTGLIRVLESKLVQQITGIQYFVTWQKQYDTILPYTFSPLNETIFWPRVEANSDVGLSSVLACLVRC